MTKKVKTTKKTKQVQKKPATKVVAKDTKQCPKCGRTLSVENFPHDYRRKDTLYIYCRECEAKRQYIKHTKSIVKKAEEQGYTVLTMTSPAPKLTVDVLKIDTDPNTCKTTFTELSPSL